MFEKFCHAYARMLHYVLLFLGFVLLGSVTLQVAGRYVPFVPRWLWPVEVANWALIWFVFVGASLAVRDGRHFTVDIFLGKPISRGLHVALRVLYYLIVGSVTGVFIVFGYAYLVDWGFIQVSDIIGVNLGVLYFSVPFSGVTWLVFLIENVIKDLSGRKTAPMSALEAAKEEFDDA